MRTHLLLSTVAATLALTAPALAAGPLDPGARIFPLAGSGTAAPAEGTQAGTARVPVLDVQPLPDGSTLLLVNRTRGATALERVTPDGALHAIPQAGPAVSAMALRPDGTLAFVIGADQKLRHLDLTTGVVTFVANLAGTATGSSAGLADVVTLDDGTDVVSDGSTAFRVSPAGAVTRAYPKSRDAPYLVEALAALPGGAFALANGNRDEVTRVDPDGTLTDLGATDVSPTALAGQPDGSVLVASGNDALTLVRAGAKPQSIASGVDGPDTLGNGDGGSLAHALVPASALAFDAEGNLLVGGEDGLRIVPTEPTSLGLAALAPAGYVTLRTGAATVTSTGAGTATVRLATTANTRESSVQAVPAGGGDIAMGFVPPPALYAVTVTFTAAATGRVTVSRTTVDTRRKLAKRVALKAIDAVLANEGDGDEEEQIGAARGACRRHGALHFECVRYTTDTTYSGSRHQHAHTTRGCGGRIDAAIRPDGLRVDELKGSCRL